MYTHTCICSVCMCMYMCSVLVRFPHVTCSIDWCLCDLMGTCCYWNSSAHTRDTCNSRDMGGHLTDTMTAYALVNDSIHTFNVLFTPDHSHILSSLHVQNRQFNYDHVLQPSCTQLQVYSVAARPLVQGNWPPSGIRHSSVLIKEVSSTKGYRAGTIDSVLIKEVSSFQGSFVYLAGTIDSVLIKEVSSFQR